MKTLELISDKWFIAICRRVTSFGNLKCDYVTKAREMFNILPLINNLVTI